MSHIYSRHDWMPTLKRKTLERLVVERQPLERGRKHYPETEVYVRPEGRSSWYRVD